MLCKGVLQTPLKVSLFICNLFLFDYNWLIDKLFLSLSPKNEYDTYRIYYSK